MAQAKKTEAAAEAAPAPAVIIAYKGFDPDWSCRGYQYEIGKTFVHQGKVEACANGFHSCENPLDVFGYYPPETSRYAEVQIGGAIARHAEDSKIASAEITLKAELKLPDFIARAVKYVIDHATAGGQHETGDQSAASATGDQSAASATGYRSAASATGDQSAASATGDRSAAMASGYDGRVSGKKGNALFLVERDESYEIIAVWAGIVGRDGIEEDVFYALRGGAPVPA